MDVIARCLDLPEHFQDELPEGCSSGSWDGLTGTEKYWVVGNDAQRRCGRKEMVQIPAGNRPELLLQVDPLRLRQTGSR